MGTFISNKSTVKRGKTYIYPAWMVVLGHLALIGLGLMVFAYFHHVRPRELKPQTLALETNTMEPAKNTQIPENSSPAVTKTPEPTTEPTVSPDDIASKFSDKFSTDLPIKTENSYKSKNVSVEVSRHEQDGTVYFVQDIYLTSVKYLKTAFAGDVYGMGYAEKTPVIAAEHNAIAAINGDYYGHSEQGVVIRNGAFYRDTPFRDVCVIYEDGAMKTFSRNDFNAPREFANGAYHAWGFGPMLLDSNGQPMTKFDSDVAGKNPRTVIGYYEPGHYCFVVVDGRDAGYSQGFTLAELSQLMYDLGCSAAYNLDGGQTSVMCFDGNVVNSPAGGGRVCSDIVYIGDSDGH